MKPGRPPGGRASDDGRHGCHPRHRGRFAPHPASAARFWASVLDGFAVEPYDETEIGPPGLPRHPRRGERSRPSPSAGRACACSSSWSRSRRSPRTAFHLDLFGGRTSRAEVARDRRPGRPGPGRTRRLDHDGRPLRATSSAFTRDRGLPGPAGAAGQRPPAAAGPGGRSGPARLARARRPGPGQAGPPPAGVARHESRPRPVRPGSGNAPRPGSFGGQGRRRCGSSSAP